LFRSSSIWAGVISAGITQLQDTVSLSKGKMNRNRYAVNTAANLSGAVGLTAGVEYGALLGTMLFPGPGTVVGTIAGGLIGDRLGRWVGEGAASSIYQIKNAQAPREKEFEELLSHSNS
jgi:outer membrane lipoprotein SlyB